jgi:hypothetical protein
MRFLTENVDGHVPEYGGTWQWQFVCKLVSCVTLSSEKTQWELFWVAWTCCDSFMTAIWEIVNSCRNCGLVVRLGLIEAYLIPYSVGGILAWSQVCLNDLVEFNYSRCRIDQLLHLVVEHSVEIRLHWKIGAIWSNDFENELNLIVWCEVWFFLIVDLQKKFWNFTFAFSHFLVCTMISTNRIICKVVISEDLEHFSSVCEMMVLAHDWPDCVRYFSVIQLHSIAHIVEMLHYYLLSIWGSTSECDQYDFRDFLSYYYFLVIYFVLWIILVEIHVKALWNLALLVNVQVTQTLIVWDLYSYCNRDYVFRNKIRTFSKPQAGASTKYRCVISFSWKCSSCKDDSQQ